MDEPGTRAVRVVVRGRVQGVGFWAWLQGQAELHDLAGWVRNLADGSVEAVLVGPVEAVDIVLHACRDGPHPARVDQVEEYPAEPSDTEGVPTGAFVQRR